MSDREQEDVALRVLTAVPALEWIDAEMLAVNWGDEFEDFKAARSTLERLEEQGLAERSESSHGPFWRATGRGVRAAKGAA